MIAERRADPGPSLDELLHRANHLRFWGKLNKFEARFVLGMTCKAKRRSWRPSRRQLELLQSIVGADGGEALIEAEPAQARLI